MVNPALDIPQQMLEQLIRERGIADMLNRQRCLALLRDYCTDTPGAAGPIYLLVTAIDLNIPRELLTPKNIPRQMLVRQMVERLQQQMLVQNHAARWAVESWERAIQPLVGGNANGNAASRRPVRDNARGIVEGIVAAHDRAVKHFPLLRFLAPSKTQAASRRSGNEVIVDPAGPITSIQDAITQSQDGGTIRVNGGIHTQPLVLHRDIRILASKTHPSPQLIVTDDSCIVMRSTQATVSGFVIKSQRGKSHQQRPAVDIESGRLELLDCEITTDMGPGVRARGSGCDPVIRNVVVHGGATDGIVITDNARGQIEFCQITGALRTGISVHSGGDPIVRLCSIENCRGLGVAIEDGGRGLFELCNIRRSETVNVAVVGHAEPLFRRCTIRETRGHNMLFDSSAGGVVENSDIEKGESSGVTIRGGAKPTLRGCRISRNGRFGIDIEDNSGGVIEDCSVTDNQEAMRVSATAAPAITGSDLLVPKRLKTLNPRLIAPPGVYRGILLGILASAAVGAGVGALCNATHAGVERGILFGIGMFWLPVLFLWSCGWRQEKDTQRTAAVALALATILGVTVGTFLGRTGQGWAAGALLAGILTLLAGLFVERESILNRALRIVGKGT